MVLPLGARAGAPPTLAVLCRHMEAPYWHGQQTCPRVRTCTFINAVPARRGEEQRERQLQPWGTHRSAESKLLLELQQLQVGESPAVQQQQEEQQEHQQQQDEHQQGQQPDAPRPKPKQQREQFSPFPECLPLPSVVKQAQRHHLCGRYAKALQLLCPGPPLLLYAYASQAGNLQLLVELVQDQGDKLNAPILSTRIR